MEPSSPPSPSSKAQQHSFQGEIEQHKSDQQVQAEALLREEVINPKTIESMDIKAQKQFKENIEIHLKKKATSESLPSITPPDKTKIDQLKSKYKEEFFKNPDVLFAVKSGAISHVGYTKEYKCPVFKLNFIDDTDYQWLFTPEGCSIYLDAVSHKDCLPDTPFDNGVFSNFMHMMWVRYNCIFGGNRGREIIAEWVIGEPRETFENKAIKQMALLIQNPNTDQKLREKALQSIEDAKALDCKENELVEREQKLIFPPSQPFENPRTPMEEKVKMTLTALPELLKLYNAQKIKYAGYPDPIGRPVFYFTNVPNMSFVCSRNGPRESKNNYKGKFLASTYEEAKQLKLNFEHANKEKHPDPKASWFVPSIKYGTYSCQATELLQAMEVVYNTQEALNIAEKNHHHNQDHEDMLFALRCSLQNARAILDLFAKQHNLTNPFNPSYETLVVRKSLEPKSDLMSLPHLLQQKLQLESEPSTSSASAAEGSGASSPADSATK